MRGPGGPTRLCGATVTSPYGGCSRRTGATEAMALETWMLTDGADWSHPRHSNRTWHFLLAMYLLASCCFPQNVEIVGLQGKCYCTGKARKQFIADRNFHVWLQKRKSRLSKDDRSALILIGQNIGRARELFKRAAKH